MAPVIDQPCLSKVETATDLTSPPAGLERSPLQTTNSVKLIERQQPTSKDIPGAPYLYTKTLTSKSKWHLGEVSLGSEGHQKPRRTTSAFLLNYKRAYRKPSLRGAKSFKIGHTQCRIPPRRELTCSRLVLSTCHDQTISPDALACRPETR